MHGASLLRTNLEKSVHSGNLKEKKRVRMGGDKDNNKLEKKHQ